MRDLNEYNLFVVVVADGEASAAGRAPSTPKSRITGRDRRGLLAHVA